MALLAQTFFICVSTLALSLACVRVENHGAENTAAPVPFYSSEAYTLSAEDQTEGALSSIRRMDSTARGSDGQPAKLAPEEHMRRAAIYQANRAFEEARAHWQALVARYPNDRNVPAAFFGIGRTLFQEKRYEEALPVFEKLGNAYPQTEAGRDGFYYVAATLLRMARAGDAAVRYAEYTERFPEGERVENAYLNIIDSWREAGRFDESINWIARTRQRFAGTPTDTSALFARLRLDVARRDWQSALRSADELGRASYPRSVNTTPSEVAYLRAYSLEQMGRKDEAVRAYGSIPDSANSYYGGLATSRMQKLGSAGASAAASRENRVRAEIQRSASNFPAPYRDAILRAVKGRSVDPRLMLAIMRQESGFNPTAKSPVGARGLMQMNPEVAAKYGPRVNLNNVREDDLYRPEINLLLASEYISELLKMFRGMPEAVAASYNGGEENVARWIERAVHSDPGIFTAEVGFTESKDYVNKVLANYRAYKQLYTEDLKPRR
ncbi:MAG TPA: transglycosylase SLT domain-containing protein [Pyrinomonadaceae bacterium]|jgi:soluble lytic murein transglycosylase|nr:transglycosylase SLT domain-containing protein [Pyrinomonadaceae bacterium]